MNYPWYESCLAVLAIDTYKKTERFNHSQIPDSHDPMARIMFRVFGVSESELEAFEHKLHRQGRLGGDIVDLFHANEFWKFLKDLISENKSEVISYQSFDEHLAQLKNNVPKTRARQIWRIISRYPGFLENLKDYEKLIDDEYKAKVKSDIKFKIQIDEMGKKYLDDPSLTIQGAIESWEGTWGYMRAEGEAKILGT